MKKIEMFATGDGGEGYVQSLGVYDDICEIQIRCGMFAPDTVISFELVSGKEAD